MKFYKVVTISFDLGNEDTLSDEDKGAIHHYCVTSVREKEWKARDIEHLVEQIEQIHGYQVATLNVIDT